MANLLLPVLMLGVMYFLLIVPQRKKQKAHADLMRRATSQTYGNSEI